MEKSKPRWIGWSKDTEMGGVLERRSHRPASEKLIIVVVFISGEILLDA